jgi:hypothetical protein
MKSNSFQELGFGLFHKNTGQRDVQTEKLLNNIDIWQKLSPAFLSVTTFLDKFDKVNLDNWRLYYSGTNFHIVTDNPIIFEKYESFSSLHEELFCPLSSNILIVSTKRNKPDTLTPVFRMNLDLLLFHYAFRFVACSNKEYLEFLAREAFTTLNQKGFVEKLKEDIFNTFPQPT